MSEKTKRTPNKKPNYTRRRLAAAGAAALATYGGIKIAESGNAHAVKPNDAVREYIVHPHDTAWTVANRAFPSKAGDPEKMFEVRHEIANQLPSDGSHQEGIIQPGDVLVFADSAKIGREKSWAEASEDLPRRAVKGYYNSYVGKDGKPHWFYDDHKAAVISNPID